MRTTRDYLIGVFSWIVSILICPAWGYALPEGGEVVGGAATIQAAGPCEGCDPNQMNIYQSTDRALINWNQFNIGANEGVRFVQPGSESVALNRVTGIDPSTILGTLVANGRVFLINPNGILFGSNSVVDVAGLLATTLTTDAADFMSGGNLLFEGDRSSVVNQGRITVSENGFVFLIAPGVSNEGLIMARLGKVVMGSGERLAIDFMGDGLLQYSLDGDVLGDIRGPGGVPLTVAVDQRGEILAEGGEVVLSATASSEIFQSLINQEGIIRANSLVNRGGIIRLEASLPVENAGKIGRDANLGGVKGADGDVVHAGILDVSGAAGGKITLSGERVGVSGEINAHGGNVLVTSATKTIMTQGSKIDASGIGTGDAGNVVIWSDGTTVFGGDILARGGESGGDAGDVEVSGYQHLGFTGHVDLMAPYGERGTLLLDPASLTITKGAGTGALDTFSQNRIKNITSDLVLEATNSITIEKLENGELPLPINLSLTLKTDTGGITFKSTGDAIRASGTGGITISQGAPKTDKLAVGKLTVEGGTINITANGDITVEEARTNTSSGTVNITSNAGSLIDNGSNKIVAHTATLSALQGNIKAAAGQGNDYDVEVTHLTLRVGQNFDLRNIAKMETLDITSTQAGDTNTYQLQSGALDFDIADGGDFYRINSVVDNTTLKNFTFNGDQEIRVGNLSVGSGGKVNLISGLGSIMALTSGTSNIAASAVTLSAGPSGSIGSIGVGAQPIRVNTSDLTLASGANINVFSSSDLNVLALTASTQVGATSSYSVGATNLTFTVTDAGPNYLITTVTDTTGLNFTFKGDKTINVGKINVTTGGGTGVVTEPVVTLTSTAGQINDNETEASKDIDIKAATVVLTAELGIGMVNGDLDLDVDLLTAKSTKNNINLNELDNLALDTVDAGTGNVTIKAGGAINDNTNDALADITAKQVTLDAKSGIGNDVAKGNVDLSVTTVASAKTNTGGINLQSLMPSAILRNIQTTDKGDITLNGHGKTIFENVQSFGGNIVLTVDSGNMDAYTITAGGEGDITLTTTTSGDLAYASVVAEGNKIIVTAKGTITNLDDAPSHEKIVPDAVFGDLTGLDGVAPSVSGADFEVGADQVIEVSMIPGGKKAGNSAGEKLYLMEGEGLGLDGEQQQKENVIPPPTGGIDTGEFVPAAGEEAAAPSGDKGDVNASSDSDMIEIDEGLGIEKGGTTATSTSTGTEGAAPQLADTEEGSSGADAAGIGAIKEEAIPLRKPKAGRK